MVSRFVDAPRSRICRGGFRSRRFREGLLEREHGVGALDEHSDSARPPSADSASAIAERSILPHPCDLVDERPRPGHCARAAARRRRGLRRCAWVGMLQVALLHDQVVAPGGRRRSRCRFEHARRVRGVQPPRGQRANGLSRG
jgi:hypothetical protein